MTARRTLLPLPLVLLPALVGLAACGSETVDATDTTAAGGAISYPTAGNQPVVRLTSGGGFVPEGADFRTPAELVIEGDGSVFRPGAQIEIYPAPLLPAVTVAPLDPEGMQIVLEAAEQAGLLAPAPDYDGGASALVADAPTTVLEIQADGQTYRHEAYALGFEDDTAQQSSATEARSNLNDFVNQLRDLPTMVGDHLGPDEVYETERFGVIARPATPEELAPTEDQITPTVVAWPAAAPPLASMATCTEVPAADVAGVFNEANQLTRFTQDDASYVVFVRALTPDESCAALQA
jgi:hypothetical protein